MRVILGFDYGTKRIGVAVGQELTGSATALVTLAARDGVPDWQQITQLVQEWQPHAFVIGLPLHADGSANAVTQAAKDFGQQLQERYRLHSYWMDERLSSTEALQRYPQRPGRAGRKSDLDKFAAQIIVESWLAQHT